MKCRFLITEKGKCPSLTCHCFTVDVAIAAKGTEKETEVEITLEFLPFGMETTFFLRGEIDSILVG